MKEYLGPFPDFHLLKNVYSLSIGERSLCEGWVAGQPKLLRSDANQSHQKWTAVVLLPVLRVFGHHEACSLESVSHLDTGQVALRQDSRVRLQTDEEDGDQPDVRPAKPLADEAWEVLRQTALHVVAKKEGVVLQLEMYDWILTVIPPDVTAPDPATGVRHVFDEKYLVRQVRVSAQLRR